MGKKKIKIGGIVIFGAGSILALMFLNMSGWKLYEMINDHWLGLFGFVTEDPTIQGILMIVFGIVLAMIFGGIGYKKGIKEMLN